MLQFDTRTIIYNLKINKIIRSCNYINLLSYRVLSFTFWNLILSELSSSPVAASVGAAQQSRGQKKRPARTPNPEALAQLVLMAFRTRLSLPQCGLKAYWSKIWHQQRTLFFRSVYKSEVCPSVLSRHLQQTHSKLLTIVARYHPCQHRHLNSVHIGSKAL